LKEDRLKTGADLLVQAARGYRRDKHGRWEKAFAPCHAILFEDLTRYRMRTDRPRRENSQLMKWAHRAMPQEVQMQAELHGIHVIETGAAFSSRFHAATHTPGIRMKAISKRDLGDEFMLDIIERQNPGTNRSSLKVGQLVQMDGGEIFVCPTKDGIKQLHADVNAAQNLQRRFFTRHEDAFRIVARKVFVDGKEVWVPKTMGKRLVGALGGHGVLQLTGHDSGSCRFEPIQKRQWAKLAGESLGDDEKAGSEEDEELARLEEEALERTGEVIVYFRDPSGVVLPSDLWYPQRTFWSIVKSQTLSRVRAET
jgi:IS605 OrfB family transposase